MGQVFRKLYFTTQKHSILKTPGANNPQTLLSTSTCLFTSIVPRQHKWCANSSPVSSRWWPSEAMPSPARCLWLHDWVGRIAALHRSWDRFWRGATARGEAQIFPDVCPPLVFWNREGGLSPTPHTEPTLYNEHVCVYNKKKQSNFHVHAYTCVRTKCIVLNQDQAISDPEN